MTFDDIETVYFVLLLALHVPVLEASEAARGLTARDAESRWWEVES